MSINRRQFLAASACTGALSACTSVKPPKVKSTRFKPMSISGLEERPDFWRVRPEEIIEGCESVKKGRADVIAHTPLGYPVYAVFYGDFSEPPPQSNWSAGSASTSWKSYYGASGSALKIRNRVDAAGGVVLNCRAWRENFGYLARPFKAHYLAEPDTEELVRRVTLAEATR